MQIDVRVVRKKGGISVPQRNLNALNCKIADQISWHFAPKHTIQKLGSYILNVHPLARVGLFFPVYVRSRSSKLKNQ
ncbi:MAG: hypothetical protein COA47_07185 [Robiginitomaculum sp.]|nr:MAG: hypothetical protein COA47_07185 [Robiginitomaculum sp.]